MFRPPAFPWAAVLGPKQRGTAPPGVTVSDVYRAMYPFVVLQIVGLVLCIYFPSIVLSHLACLPD